MQQNENLVYINNGVNGQQIDAIHTRRSGWVQIQPDRPPNSVRTRIGSNSTNDPHTVPLSVVYVY